MSNNIKLKLDYSGFVKLSIPITMIVNLDNDSIIKAVKKELVKFKSGYDLSYNIICPMCSHLNNAGYRVDVLIQEGVFKCYNCKFILDFVTNKSCYP